jgi:lipoic acid synthetase
MSEKHERLPPWLHIRPHGNFTQTFDEVHEHGLRTVCEEASCPNLALCYKKKRATFLLLGPACTRKCGFCGIQNMLSPPKPNVEEIEKVASYCKSAQIREVVLTMVTRDDLQDGGAAHVADAIGSLHKQLPDCSIEVLTSDFNGNVSSLHTVLDAKVDVFAHNLETVEALTPNIRSVASYKGSLEVLLEAISYMPNLLTKSGMMLGLGETKEQVHAALCDLKRAGVHTVTLGQYLRPSKRQISVQEYVSPEQFQEYERYALSLGFSKVLAGPFVRSSLHV